MLDQLNRFVITVVGLSTFVFGVYCVIQALLLATLPMQGIYYAVLGFGALWSGGYMLRQIQ